MIPMLHRTEMAFVTPERYSTCRRLHIIGSMSATSLNLDDNTSLDVARFRSHPKVC